MVFGQNLATCSKCGKGYITGDCIDLMGSCDDCIITEKMKNPCKEVDLTHLVPPLMREKLKKEISTILNDALAGVVDLYKLEQSGMTYIRWGLVAKHIEDAVDLYWPKENDNNEG
jgi:hypothetical protein